MAYPDEEELDRSEEAFALPEESDEKDSSEANIDDVNEPDLSSDQESER